VKVRVTDPSGTRVVDVALEDYVLGAVRGELAPDTLRDDTAAAMLEVQAIVSRTYVLANLHRHGAEGFDVCDGTHCQVYRAPAASGGAADRVADPATRAVAATRGLVITFEGRAIQALFHANCGGHTASAAAVWGGAEEAYLAGVPDWFCSRKAPLQWTYAADEPALVRALAASPATDVGASLQQIEVPQRDAAGRALMVTLVGARTSTVRADAFRTVMRQAFGERAIRSAWFTVEREGGRFVFNGVGAGHGVGLCQAGALQRSRAGFSAADIISHYFPGTRIQPASSAILPAVPFS
jgi:stage II sporulation protein D